MAPPGLRSLLVLLIIPVVVSPPCRSQDPASTAARLAALEARLSDHDALAARVVELESRLSRYESSGAPSSDPLEQLINDRLVRAAASCNVAAPKSASLTISGQARFRFEWRDPFDYRIPGTFGRPAGQDVADDNDRVEQRIRLAFDARVLPDVRAFVQLQDSRLWGEEGNVLADTEQVDLHQGFVDLERLACRPLTLRVGRQELSYGDQRMISPLDWSNVGRSWDGVRAWYAGRAFQLDAFLTDIREEVNGVTDDDQIFGGVYYSYTGLERHWIDAYFLFRHDTDGSFANEAGLSGDREDQYLGARFKGSLSAFDYSAEAAWQFGSLAGDDVSAFGSAVNLGCTFSRSCWSPRLAAEWTFATGDDDPADGESGTFDPPYPFGHNYQGWMDVFAWKNGHDFALLLTARPSPRWTVGAAFHHFVLDSSKDAWYGANGRVIRRDPAGSAGTSIGSEIDLHAKLALNPAATLYFGYSHFFAGSYVSDTGPSPDQDWVWVQLTVEF